LEVPLDGGAPNATEEEGVHNAEGPPDEEAYVGVSDLEGGASEPDTEGDGRSISLQLTQLTSGTPVLFCCIRCPSIKWDFQQCYIWFPSLITFY
jgi:hypothetical protein